MKITKTEPGVDKRHSWKNPLHHARWLYATFIQNLFSFAPRGHHHWEEDEENTEILITDEAPFNAAVMGDRPGITFTRAPVGFFQLGFDDMLQYDYATGRKTKSLLVPGTMVINCCSRNDLESEHIAWIVAEHLWLLRDVLMKAGFYDVGRNMQVGSPTPAGSLVANDQGDEWFNTSVSSPFHLYRTSEFTPLNQQIVNEIGLRLTTTRTTIGTRVPSPEGANLPYQVQQTSPPRVIPSTSTAAPVLPHPLNPAQLVTYKVVGATRPGIKPPSIGGRPLPITSSDVGNSSPATGQTVNVKV